MHAAFVAAGILLSRILGLVRESLKARYLGATTNIAADAFNAAFSVPNSLQNLFGEGALSASFIPVYANALARGDQQEASRVASAIGAILGLVTAILVLLGIVAAPLLVDALLWGFEGEKRDLTIRLVRILFPGAALFVFSAWCLGILNSHRRFFLSYAAPVAWNVAMIVALLLYRRRAPIDLVFIIAWASVVGAGLTFAVQLPVVLRVVSGLRATLGRGDAAVRSVIRNFGPAFLARGVLQISAFIDRLIASFLPGAVSLLAYTQTLVMLPVSLFGMAVSAAELPAMSSALGSQEEVAAQVRGRLNTGLRHIAFFVIPSAIGFLLLGDTIIRALFQGGRFTPLDARFSWGILAAASLGLLATTQARLYSSSFYALHDTRTPLRFAVVRVTLAAGLGAGLAFAVPALTGIAPQWGAAMLALASSIAGWVELTLLRRGMNRRIGETGLGARYTATLLAAAAVAGALAFVVKPYVADLNRFVAVIVAIGTFAAVYFAAASLFRVPEMQSAVRRLRGSR
ncbi:MAG: murein biosynthesis integral membrane protein MurJ [Gemmatimonadaceae bacterium]